MKKIAVGSFLVLFLLCFSVPQLFADYMSSFDTGAEGWTALPLEEGGVTALSWTGGNVSATDLSDNDPEKLVWTFASPESWSGDFTSYIGGTVEYDLKIEQNDAQSTYYSYNLAVALDLGGAVDGSYLGWFPAVRPTIGEWNHFSVVISEDNFEVIGSEITFAEAIKNITGVYIEGDYLRGITDVTYLDNVKVSPVPEPGTILLLGSGLIGLLGLRKKFRKH